MTELADFQVKWYYKYPWTRASMFVYCLLCVMVGIVGLTQQPSPAFENLFGSAMVYFYSATLVVAGLGGAVGILRSLRATVYAVWTIAGATLFHGISLMAYPTGLQTGLRLAIAPLMMVPLAWTWWQWLVLVIGARDNDHWWRLTPRNRK